MSKRIILSLFALSSLISASARGYLIDGIVYELYFKDNTACVANSLIYYDYEKNYTYQGDVTIPSTIYFEGYEFRVTGINEYAFSQSTELTSVSIPEGVNYIGYEAFAGCEQLSSVNFPESLYDIGIYAFEGCESLSSIYIPKNVTYIGDGAFRKCSGLTSITVDPDNKMYDSRDNCNAIIESIDSTSIVNYEEKRWIKDFLVLGCKNTVIPSTVTKIARGAFSGSKDLTSIYIPYSVESIYGNPFQGCSDLVEIVVSPDNKSYDSRDNCNAIIDKRNNALICGCKNTIIPDNVTSIADGAFYECKGLKSLVIPQNVTEIGLSAFGECTSLESINIPKGVSKIAAYTFTGCRNLKSIIIPEGVSSIESDCFRDCISLTSVTIPSTVDSIGIYWYYSYYQYYEPYELDSVYTLYENSPFSGCISLGSITVAPDNKVYDSRNNCNAIIRTETNELVLGCKTTTIPAGVTIIGHDAFYDCIGLSEIEIPNGVQKICEFAFFGCTGLTSITFPESLVEIEPYAFEDCTELNSVFIPVGVKRIDHLAFADCIGLTSIQIPDGLTYLGDYAFKNCKGLKTIHIPSGFNINNLKNHPFKGCDNVDTLYWNYRLFSEVLASLFGGNSYDEIRLPFKSIVFGDSVSVFEHGYYNWDFSALTSITMCSRNPGQMQIDAYYFNTVDFDNCVLYVPYGGRYAYSTAAAWVRFKNIRYSDEIVHGVCIDDMYYEITSYEDKTASLIRGKNEYSVVVPASVTIDGVKYAVTGIDTESFSDCDELASIRIPGSVEFIAERTFENCIALNRVVIEGSPEIAVNAFIDSPNIESVYSIGFVPGKINYLNPFIGGEFDNIKATSGRKYAEYNDELSRTVTMVTRRECEILMNGIPAGRYRVSVGIVPSPENKPNRFHPAILGITDTTDIVLFDSVTIATKPRPRRTPYTVGNQDKFTYDTITTYIEEFDTYFDDYVFVSSEYDSVLLLDTFVVPDKLKGLRISISEKNADTIIIDRVFFEPLDDISEDKYAGPFTESVFNNATLYVLEEAVDAYRNADGWKLFKNIGIDTAVKPLRKETRKIIGNEPIYDVAGRRQNVQSIDELAPGLYIIGGKSYLKR